MNRQLVTSLGLFVCTVGWANDSEEKLHQQLGMQGYFYAPTNPEAVLLLKRSSEGRYLVCLSSGDKKKHFIYEVTDKTFPNGHASVFVRCRDGEMTLSKG